MKKLAILIAALGGIMVLGTAMLAFDTYMTDDRKQTVRAEVNSSLDASAAHYEDRRAAGCRRRCAGGLSHMLVGLRDGIFMSRPFDPEIVMPFAPDGWVQHPYSLAAAEQIMGRDIRRTKAPAETNNALLLKLDNLATKGSHSSVQIYSTDGKSIAVAVSIDRDAVRKAKDGEVRLHTQYSPPAFMLSGLPVTEHPRTSHDWRTGKDTPVAYRHYTLNLDGQVDILILGVADEEDFHNLLSTFDMATVVASLPHLPVGYDQTSEILVSNVSTEQEG